MNGSEVCLASGLECGFLGLGVVMWPAIVAPACTPSYLRAAVIHGLVIASWDWRFSCCVFTVSRDRSHLRMDVSASL